MLSGKHERKYSINELIYQHDVPDAGTAGSPAGGTNRSSMGSAAVPMGKQDKHDQLLRITPTRSTGEEGNPQLQDVSYRMYPWRLSSEPQQNEAELI
jgi:hypothetical protein